MMFVDRIEHGEILLNSSVWRGDPPIFLSGEEARETIKDYLDKARDREERLFVVTRKLLGEGIDVPTLDVLINMGGGKAVISFTQMFGRGTRIAEGKEGFLYLDFLDQGNKYLEDHAKARIRHCKKLGQEVEIVHE